MLPIRDSVLCPLCWRLVGEIETRPIIPNISPHENPLLVVDACARVPDLRNVTRRPRDAAVNMMVALPKSPLGLKSDFSSWDIWNTSYCMLDIRREIVVDPTQHR